MERQKLLALLYKALPDQTRVRVGTKVSKIQRTSGDGVQVHTVNGDVFHADLVVGADGVHSSTRSELWKETGSEIESMLPNGKQAPI